jgi:metallophosphoesterase (TIGR00282 family)
MAMRFLIVGDVIGNPGRRAIKKLLPHLKEEIQFDFFILNGENLAGGFGITKKIYQEVKSWSVDVITGGNHTWDKKEIFQFIEEAKDLLRPANYPPSVPGRGWNIFEKKGLRVGVINLMGLAFMNPYLENPFLTFDRIYEEIKEMADIVVVDFHAEATAEKNAFALYALGRAQIIFGTHTHIPTADERIIEGKTAYITDVGMTGVLNSVIGVNLKDTLPLYLQGIKKRFHVAEKGEVVFNALVVDIDETSLKPLKVQRLQKLLPWEELKGISV